VGRRGKVKKWRLYKKSGQSNINLFRFAKGSSHMFKHKGKNQASEDFAAVDYCVVTSGR